ncbi:hypothetical protein F4677DRAFT_429729 [Hypoxylon crocopeplum]|nr:hypothetical protein F4677DRAFT_429729 [Hypoxylon crocopeplum]
MSPPSTTSVRRCGVCRRQNQKCIFTLGNERCDRCLENGYSCRQPTEGPTGYVLASSKIRNNFKCDYCRTAHESCLPLGRVWPERCEYCVGRDLPCSVARTKKEFDQLRAVQNDAGYIAAARRIKENPASGASSSVSTPMPSNIDAADSDSSYSPTDAPVRGTQLRKRKNPFPPPGVQTRRMKESEGDPEPGMIEKIEQEFKEILKSEQDKHRLEMKMLKDQYQEELDQQRRKYESRIDDLINIMKTL